jgi:hypothetical protein
MQMNRYDLQREIRHLELQILELGEQKQVGSASRRVFDSRCVESMT